MYLDPRRVFYGWWLVGLTAFVFAVVISPIFLGLGTFFVALEDEFGWSRAALAGAFSLARAEDAVISPLAGYLTDKLGTRRLVPIGFFILGIGFVMFSFVQSLVWFYIAFMVLTIGAGFASFLPLIGAINNWFIRRKATAIGLAQTGMSLGGVLVPVLAWAIASGGWRTTALLLAGLMWMIALPIGSIIRNRPEDFGQRPDGDTPKSQLKGGMVAEPDDDMATGMTASQAVRTSAFWLISLAHAFPALAFITISIHAIPMITDRGFSLAIAASVVMTYTVIGGIFQLIGGFVGDRVPKRTAIAVFIGIQGAGVLLGAVAESIYGLFLFAVVFGIGFGGRVPLLVAIRGDYFGRRAFATIFGLSTIPMSLITLSGPVVVGYVFDVTGSYLVPLLGVFVLNMLGAGFILIVPRLVPLTSEQRRGSAGL